MMFAISFSLVKADSFPDKAFFPESDRFSLKLFQIHCMLNRSFQFF